MILIAAAKTMNDSEANIENNFNYLTNDLVSNIKEKTKEEMGILFKIKDKTLDKTYEYYKNFNYSSNAIKKYNGVVFKELKNKDDLKKYEDLYIISALYGIVSAGDKINSYRLDFNSNKVVGLNLYKYWDSYIENFIDKRKPKMILNLCSNEYFKAINKNVRSKYKIISIESNKKLPSTTLKKVRGNVLNYIIDNNIKDYTNLKNKETELVKFIELKGDTLIFELKE